MRSSFSTIFLLYHLLSIWDFLILTCTIYILAPERVYGEVWGMAAAQDKSNRHETVEEAENHLQKSELLKPEESQWI